jgi:hypothetical protein
MRKMFLKSHVMPQRKNTTIKYKRKKELLLADPGITGH